MVGKFREIKSVEEEVQAKIEEARKKGEERVIETENQENSQIIKIRNEIKQERHKLIEKSKKDAEDEALKLEQQTKKQISQIKFSEEEAQKISKKLAESLIL